MNNAIFTLSDVIIQSLMAMGIGFLICNALHGGRTQTYLDELTEKRMEEKKPHSCPRCEEKLRGK